MVTRPAGVPSAAISAAWIGSAGAREAGVPAGASRSAGAAGWQAAKPTRKPNPDNVLRFIARAPISALLALPRGA